MNTVPQPRFDQPHQSAFTATDTQPMEVAYLREQNQQLRELVVQLSKLVVKHVLEK
jgi:hypothetical protein